MSKPAAAVVIFRAAAAVFLCAWTLSCTTVTPGPGWIRTGKADDGLYRYCLGKAERAASEAEAREAAYRNAADRMRLDLPTPLSARPGETVLFLQTIRVPDGAYAEPVGRGWNAWVLAGFARTELETLRRRIEQGNRLTGAWTELLRLKNQSRYEEAEALAARMTAGYDDPLFPPVSLEVLRQEGRRLTDLKEARDLRRLWQEMESARRGGDWAGARQRLAVLENRYRTGLDLPFDSGGLKTVEVKIDREERGARLSALWAQVPGLEARGEFQEALETVKRIQGEAAQADGLKFGLDEVDMKGADLLAGLGKANEARGFYEALMERTPSRAAEIRARLAKLPPAPRAWPLKARWKGGPVALLCAVRENGAIRPFSELTGKLAAEFAQAELRTIDVSGSMTAGALDGMFGSGDPGGAAMAAETSDAKVFLAVLYDIGPAPKPGGYDMIDTRVRFWVYRPDGTTLYADQFKAVSAGSAAARWAEYTVGVLLDPRPGKYLIPKASSL